LQHAHNPVNWYPWGEEALTTAQEEQKPILVSIGYSACHWCHVMERESFENTQIAEVMNRHFVCIKIDREERPDLDQIYMEAVQVMGLPGGWPLNVFLMPDARPFYGGTYFPPQNWANLLLQIAKAFREHREQLEDSARGFTEAIGQSELGRFGLPEVEQSVIQPEQLQPWFAHLDQKFDHTHGGMDKAPKFPMPCIYTFMLRYFRQVGEESALTHLQKTLDEMAWGGIYDQIGGGFARYSVDAQWLVPHFEKMLYDNAQLITLYAEATLLMGAEPYRQVVRDSADFLLREMTSEEGGFFSALDADSEGEEGKFYIWTYEELKDLLGDELPLFADYFQCTEAGNWEHGNNILHRKQSDEVFTKGQGLDEATWTEKVAAWKKTLMSVRSQRVRPGLDDKILASWNGWALKAMCDAFIATGDERFREAAARNAAFLTEKMTDAEGRLWHTYKDGKASLLAYLEDYAAAIQGMLAWYQVCFEEKWLRQAERWCEYVQEHFFDESEGLFFFTDRDGETLIARKKEVFDNVIPASNSVMAHNLYHLGVLLDRPAWQESARAMLGKVLPLLDREVQYLSHWAGLAAILPEPMAEVVMVGDEAVVMAHQLQQKGFYPNKVVLAAPTDHQSDLELLQGRTARDGKTTIYVCRQKACQLPVHTVEEAWAQLQGTKKGL
jgi:uncharacterized protein YyaL (SSP411 family)